MVDSAVVSRGGVVKHLKIEKPRPLRTDPLKESLRLVEEARVGLSRARHQPKTRQTVVQLKELLRLNGAAVEKLNSDRLDLLDVDLREAVSDPQLDLITRVTILEIIELRLNKWVANPAMSQVYQEKLAEAHLDVDLKKIGYQGVKEDINQNSIRDNWKASVEVIDEAEKNEEFKECLMVNGHEVMISSTSEKITALSKNVLIEFFTLMNTGEDEEATETGEKPGICYEKEELLRLSKSPLCKDTPVNWEKIIHEIPFIVKKEGASSKHFLREVEMIKKQEAARKM